MREIRLSIKSGVNAGVYVVTVDECDFGAVSALKWRVCCQGSPENRRVYAVRYYRQDGKVRSQRLHRFIWERANGPIPAGAEIDHIEPGELGGLDNRRSNLRLTNKSLNQANSRKGRNNTSGYKGVWWQAQAQMWRVDIWVERRKWHVGYFADKEQAAQAYDRAARLAFGDYARPNFPNAA